MLEIEQDPCNETPLAVAAKLAVVWLNPRAAAVFRCTPEGVCLELSDRLHQAGVDHVARLWSQRPTELRQGLAHYDGDLGWVSLVVPCMSSGHVCGLLYLEEPRVRSLSAVLLDALGRLLGAALDPVRIDTGADTARNDLIEAAALHAAMEGHEWNVARVARSLGVTRMTVYNRLRRYGVPRKRVIIGKGRRSAESGPTD